MPDQPGAERDADIRLFTSDETYRLTSILGMVMATAVCFGIFVGIAYFVLIVERRLSAIEGVVAATIALDAGPLDPGGAIEPNACTIQADWIFR